MKQSDDQTLFAWQLGYEYLKDDICGPLATSPSKFRGARNLTPVLDSDNQAPYSMTNKGLRIELRIIHQDEGKLGMAILHCSTAEAFPRQVGLPVVRLGPPGSNHYARDASCVGPLDFIYIGDATPKSVFMKQEPEVLEKWRAGLLARVPAGDEAFYQPKYWNAAATALNTEPQREFLIPASCRRGAILFTGKDQSNLLVLFNIEMQHVGRYACKVQYSPPSFPRRISKNSKTTPSQKRIQQLVHVVETTPRYIGSLIRPRTEAAHTTHIFADELAKEASWSLLHSDYGPSNSRSSFDYLPNDRAVFAHIGLQMVRGQHTLVLDVEIREHLNEQMAPYEMDGTPIPTEPAEEVPHVEEVANYGAESYEPKSG
jgi:hypothetical protein